MFDAVFAGKSGKVTCTESICVFIYNFGNQSKIKSPPILLSLTWEKSKLIFFTYIVIRTHHMRAALVHTAAAPHWAWRPRLYCMQYIISLIEGQRNQSQKKNGKESLEHKVCEIEITQEKKTKH